MTLQELTNKLQDLCHEGYSQSTFTVCVVDSEDCNSVRLLYIAMDNGVPITKTIVELDRKESLEQLINRVKTENEKD